MRETEGAGPSSPPTTSRYYSQHGRSPSTAIMSPMTPPNTAAELSLCLRLAALKNGEFSKSPKRSNNLSQALLQRRHWFNLLDHQKTIESAAIATPRRVVRRSSSSSARREDQDQDHLGNNSNNNGPAGNGGSGGPGTPRRLRKRFDPLNGLENRRRKSSDSTTATLEAAADHLKYASAISVF